MGKEPAGGVTTVFDKMEHKFFSFFFLVQQNLEVSRFRAQARTNIHETMQSEMLLIRGYKLVFFFLEVYVN